MTTPTKVVDLDKVFAEALHSYSSYMRTVIYNKSHAPLCDVDEIFQNVQLDLWKKRHLFELTKGKVGASAFKKWSAKFCHNHVIWYFSKKKRKDSKIDFDSEKFDVVTEVVGQEDDSFEDLARKESVQHLLYKYSSVLTPHEQNVFKLMWKGMGTYDIGKVLDLTHQRISQITENIRTKINKRFKSSTDEVVDDNTRKLPAHLNAVTEFFNSSKNGIRSHTVHG
mgnify:CR=1 FL=1